ncbi:hypothetical protein GCM10010277_79960 [Streptomyces longisporoflavus]|uniref:hypothetical protein n=1 Tax=Streptomyces longisporoflavus TaxID=28044 RepID=UPI00167E48EB|nr:hypothetical protein [Streptomyces longisporoflavus]GGV69657.1 hypothetical protein GCM10010277_79960 [Streptomyces longisporoflavus]
MSNQFPPPQNPQAGLPGYPGPAMDPAYAAYGAYGFGPLLPQKMPGSVRAAQVIIWTLSGMCLLGSVIGGALYGPEAAGAVLGSNFLLITLCVLAFRFHLPGHGKRVASIVLSSVQILVGFGALGRGAGPGGLILVGCSIALVILLGQGSAGAWFKRGRTPAPAQWQGQGYTG